MLVLNIGDIGPVVRVELYPDTRGGEAGASRSDLQRASGHQGRSIKRVWAHFGYFRGLHGRAAVMGRGEIATLPPPPPLTTHTSEP